MINIISSSRYPIERDKIRDSIKKLYTKLNIDHDLVLNVIFVGKIKMRQIALEYKHEDEALPILAFPYKGEKIDDEKVLGELVMCYPQVLVLAAHRNKPVDYIMDWLLEHGMTNLLKE